MENDPKHNLIEYEAPPAVQSKAKPSKTNERSKRIEQIRASLPGCTFGFASIDTDNAFSHDGDTYRVDSSVEAYRPKETADGPLYDMDQVVVVTHHGERHFYTQDYFPIE